MTDKGLKHKKWIDRALFEQEKQFEIARKLRKLSSLIEKMAETAENASLSKEDRSAFRELVSEYNSIFGIIDVKLYYDTDFLGETAEETNTLFERALLGESPRKNKPKA